MTSFDKKNLKWKISFKKVIVLFKACSFQVAPNLKKSANFEIMKNCQTTLKFNHLDINLKNWKICNINQKEKPFGFFQNLQIFKIL